MTHFHHYKQIKNPNGSVLAIHHAWFVFDVITFASFLRLNFTYRTTDTDVL